MLVKYRGMGFLKNFGPEWFPPVFLRLAIKMGKTTFTIYMNGSPGPEFTGDLFLRRSNMDEVYHISSTEKVQQLERELAVQLAELKAQIEDNGVLQGTPNRAYRYQSFSGE